MDIGTTFAKTNAVGHNCHLTQTTDGRVLVQSRNTGPMMMKGRYTGRGPFDVIPGLNRPDIVIVQREPESTEPMPPTNILTPFAFGFSLQATWEVDGSPETGYPWIRDAGGSSGPGGDNWSPVGATGTTTSDPPTNGPYRRQPDTYEASYIFSPLLVDGTTAYEITELRCWIGTIDPLPDTRAVPMIEGEWLLEVDEWIVSDTDPAPGSFGSTLNLGTFQMGGTENPADPSTWPLLSPSLVRSLTTAGGLATYEGRIYKNLRISLVP